MTTESAVTEDIVAVAARRKKGESLASIAADYGVTRERVRQVLSKTYGTTWTEEGRAYSASERENQLDAYRESVLDQIEQGEPVSRAGILDDAPSPVTLPDLMGEYLWAVPIHQDSRSSYSEADMIASIKRVWRKHVKPHNFTSDAYDLYRESSDVSAVRITQVMRWSVACAAAGVPCNESYRSSYSSLDRDLAISWVEAFLADAVENETPGSAAAYDLWAREHDAPSMGSVRKACGARWNDARASATPRVLAWQRGKGKRPTIPKNKGTSQYTEADIAAWRAARDKIPTPTIRSLSETFGVPVPTLRYHLGA